MHVDAEEDGTDVGVSFGGFAVEGLEDPLAPRHEPEYVEEIDDDPAPFAGFESDPDRLPWLGARPWSGTRDLRSPRGSAARRVVTALVVVLAVGGVVIGLAFLLRLVD